MTPGNDDGLMLPGINDDGTAGVSTADPSELSVQSGAADLARRMRPRNLEEFLGQEHLVGEGKILRRLIESDNIPSMIFFGPAGCGKTALTFIIAQRTGASYERLNAVTARLADVRAVIARAEVRLKHNGRRTLLLLDEIHRFNRAQQDAFLPHVEEGTIILVGTTTENPYFAINAPLLSRMRQFQFEPLRDGQVRELIELALTDEERGLGVQRLTINPEAMEQIVSRSSGDVRAALKGLELAAFLASHPAAGEPVPEGAVIGLNDAEEAMQKRVLLFDRTGDQHYDTASAFIKSIRGSDPDAALFWLGKMIVGGEDLGFICRRIVIAASEDVGMAEPMAPVVANACVEAAERVGYPEAKIPLAMAVVYLATAPKSNAAYKAIGAACRDVEAGADLDVPKHLKDANYPGAKELGHGDGYVYPHDTAAGVVKQRYSPTGKRYYRPSGHGYERTVADRLRKIEKIRGVPEED